MDKITNSILNFVKETDWGDVKFFSSANTPGG